MQYKKVDFAINKSFYPLLANTDRYLVMYGGAGSSKSFTAAQKILSRCSNSEKKQRILVCRKVANTIEGSCFKLLSDLVSMYDLRSKVTINKTTHSFTFANGNEIISTGLDDPEKLKSIAGVTSMWIEEATELDESDFRQLDLRLRGESEDYKQIIITFNPIDERHWLKKVFCDNKPDNCTVHHSTYLDNRFIDEEYKKMLSEQIAGDDNLRRIYLLGEWGRIITGTEFYHQFKHIRHVQPTPFIPESSIHLSFDFNVVPFCTLQCMQLVKLPLDRWQIRCFDEFCMPNPYNDPQGCCKFFLENYVDLMKDKDGRNACRLFYYGDATGRATSTTGQKDGFMRKNNFDLIKEGLRGYLDNNSERVPTFNPHLKARKQKVNRALSGEWMFDIVIDPKCKNLIGDFENVKDDPDGGKLKKMVKNKDTGQLYEEFGHCSDSFEYGFFEAFKPYMK
jgi:hypothetical protein